MVSFLCFLYCLTSFFLLNNPFISSFTIEPLSLSTTLSLIFHSNSICYCQLLILYAFVLNNISCVLYLPCVFFAALFFSRRLSKQILTLTKHRGFTKPDDEQLHVLPLYVPDTDDPNAFSSQPAEPTKLGSIS